MHEILEASRKPGARGGQQLGVLQATCHTPTYRACTYGASPYQPKRGSSYETYQWIYLCLAHGAHWPLSPAAGVGAAHARWVPAQVCSGLVRGQPKLGVVVRAIVDEQREAASGGDVNLPQTPPAYARAQGGWLLASGPRPAAGLLQHARRCGSPPHSCGLPCRRSLLPSQPLHAALTSWSPAGRCSRRAAPRPARW